MLGSFNNRRIATDWDDRTFGILTRAVFRCEWETPPVALTLLRSQAASQVLVSG